VIEQTADVRASLEAIPIPRRRGLLLSERKLLLAAGDVGLVALSLVVAFNLRTGQVEHTGFAVPWAALTTIVVIWLGVAHMVDAYNLRDAMLARGIFRAVASTITLATVALLAVFFVFPYSITRPTIRIWLALAAVCVLSWRLVYRQVFAHAFFAGRMALVADRDVLERTWPDVGRHLAGLYRIVGVVDPRRPDCIARLRATVANRQADQIVVGMRGDLPEDLFGELVSSYDRGVVVRSLADLVEELTGRLLLDQLGQTWLLSLRMRSETSRVYALFKRLVDVSAGALGLLAMSIVIAPVALAMLIEDRGPILHRQTRLGQYGHPFDILKLRTMRVDRSPSLQWAENADPRITRVGRVLRRLHLDELPQAWNVLRGHMSVVGPRPEQPHYVEQLRAVIPYYDTRLSVRPGLTGWAQVNYGYGSGIDGARIKLSYDLYYIKRQSAALDLLILARTVLAVAALRGR